MQITGKKVGSWSLPAGTSCPGAKDAEVCKGCYAKKGMYRFPVVKAVREYNRDDYKKDDWVERMAAKVSKFDYFRWFDSGDIETPLLASRIRRVINETPNTKHWLPTRSDKVSAIHKVLDGGTLDTNGSSPIRWNSLFPLNNYSNVALRLSADNIGLNNKERPGVNSYVITPEEIFEAKKQGIYVCPVGITGQKSCDTCTMCYTNNPVAYVLH